VQSNLFLILGIAGFIGALWLLWSAFKGNPESGRMATTSPLRAGKPSTHEYAAVSIHCPGGECEAVSVVEGLRFLGTEAPSLPLADCTSPQCNCSYLHHGDRRGSVLGRRIFAGPMGEDDPMFAGMNDQRYGMGRRASDWEQAYQLNSPAV